MILLYFPFLPYFLCWAWCTTGRVMERQLSSFHVCAHLWTICSGQLWILHVNKIYPVLLLLLHSHYLPYRISHFECIITSGLIDHPASFCAKVAVLVHLICQKIYLLWRKHRIYGICATPHTFCGLSLKWEDTSLLLSAKSTRTKLWNKMISKTLVSQIQCKGIYKRIELLIASVILLFLRENQKLYMIKMTLTHLM